MSDGTYGLTLPADLWLQVLQRASQCMYVILKHFHIGRLSAIGDAQEAFANKHPAAVLKTVAGEVTEVQKLMKRVSEFFSFHIATAYEMVFVHDRMIIYCECPIMGVEEKKSFFISTQ